MKFVNTADRSYRGAFTDDEYADAASFYRDAQPTPLRVVDNAFVKDESHRGSLGAFKIMGVAYALDRLLQRGAIRKGATLVCASAGNHGRAVAHAGRAHGFRVKVYMSASASPAAQERIRSEGAAVVLVDGSYDDAVLRARDDGGFVLSDTAWPGYEDVPRLIMIGYTHILSEAEKQWPSRPDAVFVQAGVGSLAAAVASWFCHRYGAERPHITCVEPVGADPLLESARAGRAMSAHATDTIMAGLNCAEASSVAVPILLRGCDAFMTIDDDQARSATQRLAAAGISAGPSGAAGYAGFLAEPSAKNAFVINTEGGSPRNA